MLIIEVRSLFKLRGIERPYSALVDAGISSQSAHKILSSVVRVFRLDHIETLCSILNCTPNDLLLWAPDKNNKIPDNHALTKLKRSESEKPLHDTLSKMTLEELRQIATIINKQASGT